MRKVMKENLMEVFKTLYEAHDVVKDYIDNGMRQNAYELLCDCQNAAIDLGNKIYEAEGDGFTGLNSFEEYCEIVYQTAISEDICGEAAKLALDEKLKVSEAVAETIPAKYEVVFLPYKASMWDSLESIWRAADADPECNARVIPIPYYDRNPDHSFASMHYEGKDFPDYVPITHYSEYDIESNQPDIIYIHNPYDNCNYVTSVAPEYYSFELKKHTPMLVYVPYHISGCFSRAGNAAADIPSAFRYVDKVILPSHAQKNYYISGGISENKFMVAGSPKIDYIVNELSNVDVPEEWSERCSGKKVILLNSTIARLLQDQSWGSSMLDLLAKFDSVEDMVLLWRPHPLLKATIASMRPQQAKEFSDVVCAMESHRNVIIDTTPSVHAAMKLSDALISDYSSIVMQYTFTGKPALLTDGTSSVKDDYIVCTDYFSNYFINDGESVEDFVAMVCDGCDDRMEERIRTSTASVVNADGSCGIKTHKEIKGLLEV